MDRIHIDDVPKLRRLNLQHAPYLKACNGCGNTPEDLPEEFHPRIRAIEAYGKPWRIRLICAKCGAYYEGKDHDAAFAAWNSGSYCADILGKAP